MSSLPASINTTSAMVAFLYQAANWPRVGTAAEPIYVFGLRPAPGWQPGRAVVVFPNGGPRPEFDGVIRERLLYWCYGPTPAASLQVADVLADVLERNSVRTCTLNEKKVFVPFANRVQGPAYLQEPETLWHRAVCGFEVEFSRWALAA